MPPYSALIDTHTCVLLTLSLNIPVIIFLNEFTSDTRCIHGANYPNYVKSFPLGSADPSTYSQSTWVAKSRTFSQTNADVLTEALRHKTKLATKKRDVMCDILRNLNIARYPVWTGVQFQETVYMTKKIQAQRFKDAGYPEDSIFEYLYVVQYADFANISMQQAADDILFKAKLDDERLAKTELLRLKYFDKVRRAIDNDELDSILQEFVRECYTVAIK